MTIVHKSINISHEQVSLLVGHSHPDTPALHPTAVLTVLSYARTVPFGVDDVVEKIWQKTTVPLL